MTRLVLVLGLLAAVVSVPSRAQEAPPAAGTPPPATAPAAAPETAKPATGTDAAPVAPATTEKPPAPAKPAPVLAPAPVEPVVKVEEICDDHKDNDGDTVYDCGDNDCRDAPNCKPDGKGENTNERCSDWIDNDGDGVVDCEDQECQLSSITVCGGSWKGDVGGTGGADEGNTGTGSGGVLRPGGEHEMPDGMEGRANTRAYSGDVEQPDSENGIGFVGIRFGVVAAVQQLFTVANINNPNVYDQRLDTRFDTLQLRAFGNLPLLEDSFFLLSINASQSPRVTFALFQFPLGGGHYVNVNSGGSTLSAQPLISAAKRPLLDTPRYLLNGFDQFLDAGVEVNGPIVLNLLRYRVFAGGGTGLFGDFGGRRFEDATVNPTYSVGAQTWFTPIGIYNRFDSPFLYRPVPLATAFAIGGKYEQREQERFPALHGIGVFRYGIFSAMVESYNKAELNFGQLQTANYLQLGLLLYPEWFFLAADVGHFSTSDFGELSKVTGIEEAGDVDIIPNALRRNRNEIQGRVALHWFFWRQNGVMTARYSFDSTDPIPLGVQRDREFPVVTHEAVLQAQFRF